MQLRSLIEDKHLKEEMVGLLATGSLPLPFCSRASSEIIASLIEDPSIGEAMPGSEAESIILLFGRPVLTIEGNSFATPVSETWRQRLESARPLLEAAIPAVGRIELKNHPTHDWVGTGWLVRQDVIVTNRHVAEFFAFRNGDQLAFRLNSGGRQITARIDFLEEYRLPGEVEMKITDVLHIEPANGPDLAFLRVEANDNLAKRQPIRLAQTVSVGQDVATIGYPAKDSRIPDPAVMREIFGDIYDVKRLAPGKVTAVGVDLEHDCSTLGGNSGSVVVDLLHGDAVGLHFGGTYRTANYAVAATDIQERLDLVA